MVLMSVTAETSQELRSGVEGGGVVEHETRVSYVRYVPRAEIGGEGGGATEHGTHVSYARYVPRS